MKNLLLFLSLGVLFRSSWSLMGFVKFQDTVFRDCYGEESEPPDKWINGQRTPLPNSIETFVSLVEQIENHYHWGIEETIKNILVNFRYDDVEVGDKTFQTIKELRISTIHDALISMFNVAPNDDLQNFFTKDERCALYFMVSHTINETTEENKQHPVEQGVVNLNGKTRHAFALGKVLLGILAGLQNEDSIKASDIYKKFKPNIPRTELEPIRFSLLYSVTISDIIYISMSKMQKGVDEDEVFYANGLWNDAVCPTQYILESKVDGYATYALFRGAIDGIQLGRMLKNTNLNRIRLSQLLRAYYSYAEDINWCLRHGVFKEQLSNINNASTSYALLINALTDTSIQNFQAIKENVEKVTRKIESLADKIFDGEVKDEDPNACSTSFSTKNKKCETPRNMFAVLDLKTTEENKETQYQIIGNLSVGFQMHPLEASMGVYTNLKPTGRPAQLDTIVSNSNISGCQSCAALYYDRSAGAENEVEVMNNLHRTLDLVSKPSEPGAPSKVVLYFNYGSPRDESLLRSAISGIRRDHSGAKIFAIGPNRDSLKPFVQSIDNDIFINNDISLVIKSLKERTCKVPAELQFKNCNITTSNKNSNDAYEGFVTPNHIQYLAMYPRYFLKSFHIKMFFSTTSGKIRVCFSRNHAIIVTDGKGDCKDVEGEGAIEFQESNPCKKRNVDNCDPFYFSVEGVKEPSESEKCSEQECKTEKQIKYKFQHEGISCNGAFFTSCSPITILITLLVSFYVVFKNWL